MKSTHTEGRQMETRFTPGPWKICSPMNPDRAYGIEAHDDAEGPDGEVTQCVAEICDGPPEVALADARLISAAPDGYAVCEALVDLCRPIDVGFDVVAHDMPVTVPASIIQAARAYLAKARGE